MIDRIFFSHDNMSSIHSIKKPKTTSAGETVAYTI